MKTRTKLTAATIATLGLGWALTGAACSDGTTPPASETSKHEVDAKAEKRAPYLPKNDVEYNNYNKAQELYDDPSSIIWCTTSWPSASSPIVTIPIAGKLTSSSVSYFPNQTKERADLGEYSGDILVESRSVDGMFHGTPGPYRYGFTPGGQYVDFTNLSVLCTTALTKFQRESTEVTVNVEDGGAGDIQKQAEAALKAGDNAKAEQILEGVGK